MTEINQMKEKEMELYRDKYCLIRNDAMPIASYRDYLAVDGEFITS